MSISYNLNFTSSPGERAYPQKLQMMPLSFRFRDALPHFGHFISLESFVGLDRVDRLGGW